uniref:Ig-like domain-containing protein n=1 Tax=Astyanax mexicanus TaxID=7994 RepID=A0A8B9JCS5_ASTMX
MQLLHSNIKHVIALLPYYVLFVLITERFKVVGPAAPLVAVAGEDLILPCSLQPNISAEGMMVEWFRLHETDTLVHLYEDYKDRNGDQMESYRGRTALFKEELKKGNASLKLSALQPSDDGAYKCFIQDVDSYLDDVTLYVEVKGKIKSQYQFIITNDVLILKLIKTVSSFVSILGLHLHTQQLVYKYQISDLTMQTVLPAQGNYIGLYYSCICATSS